MVCWFFSQSWFNIYFTVFRNNGIDNAEICFFGTGDYRLADGEMRVANSVAGDLANILCVYIQSLLCAYTGVPRILVAHLTGIKIKCSFDSVFIQHGNKAYILQNPIVIRYIKSFFLSILQNQTQLMV